MRDRRPTLLALLLTALGASACMGGGGPPNPFAQPEAGPSALVDVLDEGFEDSGWHPEPDAGEEDAGPAFPALPDAGALPAEGGPSPTPGEGGPFPMPSEGGPFPFPSDGGGFP